VDFMDDLSLLEVIVILGIVGALAYFGYKAYDSIVNDPSNLDPATGKSNGPINAIANAVFPESFPGGGASGAETYTGATSEVLLHPWDSLVSIFGGTPNDTPSVSAAVPYSQGQNPNLESGAF
jgi:hypothetical protein